MLAIAVGDVLTGLYFIGQKHFPLRLLSEELGETGQSSGVQAQVVAEIGEYFAGQRLQFSVRVEPGGTDFQRRVWQCLKLIPVGETISYGDLAKRAGMPSAIRAVASAVGRNPISILIPCHRVIGKDGSLTGYAGGLSRKEALLQLEGVTASRCERHKIELPRAQVNDLRQEAR